MSELPELVELVELEEKENTVKSNPYLDDFLALGNQNDYYTKALEDVFERLKKGEKREDIKAPTDVRFEMCHKYAWSLPTEDLALLIKKHLPEGYKIIEIGAGTGYFGWFLSQYDIDVKCYDIQPYHNSHCDNKWFEIESADEFISADYSDRALMLCWPPYSSPMAYNALNAYKGDYVIYIGEGDGGCTGDDKFHDMLYENWDVMGHNYPPNWDSISSREIIYKRKTKEEDKNKKQATE